MTALDVPTEQLAELPRGGRGAVTRLARRTQRGQGRRRLLVAALIALSVLLGVGAAIFAATMQTSDATVGLQDRFGTAPALVSVLDESAYGDVRQPDVEDLTDQQRAWLDQHAYRGSALAERDAASARLDEYLAGVQVLPDDVLPSLDVPDDEVLRFRTNGRMQFAGTSDDGPLVTDLDVTHPLAGTTFDAGGRTRPLSGDEALLSPTLMDQLAVAVGDTVRLPEVGTVDVVGSVTRAFQRSQPVAVVAPGRATTDAAWVEQIVRFADETDAERYAATADAIGQDRLAQLEVPTDEEFLAAGVAPEEIGTIEPWVDTGGLEIRDSWLGASDTSLAAIVGSTVTGLATTVAAIVGACAFAVGVRRRIREIGMLGAVGASPRQLGQLLRREGLVIGLGGAVAGAVAALLLTVPGLAVAERVVDRDLQPVLPLVGIALPVVVGAVGTYLAAAWPARTAARVPVVTALAGRVPLGAVPAWLPVIGAIAAAAGIAGLADLVVSQNDSEALDAIQLLGSVLLATLGTASLGVPVVAGAGRVADRLPLRARLAIRDTARQRTRSAAAVAALVPVMAVPVAAMTTIVTEQALWEQGTDPAQLAARDVPPSSFAAVNGPWVDGRTVPPSAAYLDRLGAALPPVRSATPLVRLGDPALPDAASVVLPYADDGSVDLSPTTTSASDTGEFAWSDQLTLATPEVLDALGLTPDAIPTDGALFLQRSAYVELPAAVTAVPVVQYAPGAGGSRSGDEQRALGVLEFARDDGVQAVAGIGLLVAPEAADRLGLTETGRATLLRLERPPTAAEAFAAYEVLDDAGGWVDLSAARPFWSTPLGVGLLVALAVLVVTLGVALVAGMTSALAATESDADVRKAVALGAPPSLRRALHGLQAWWHSAIAAVLGSALGLAVAWAYVRSLSVPTSYTPTGEVAAIDRASIVVPWLPLLGWVVVVPVLVGLIIAAVVRSAPVGAPRRRMA